MTCDVTGDRVDLGEMFHRGDDSQLYHVRATPIMATA
jgi:hypothetical protein